MNLTATRANESLEGFVKGIEELPSLPQIAVRVLALVRSPDCTAMDVERAIGSDQALATKILRLANSAFYGLPRSISSLREAVVLLGFKQVTSLVVSVSAHEMFGASDDRDVSRARLWRHVLLCAASGRCLAMRTRLCDREETFTAGLLHDLGKAVLAQSAREQYLHIAEQSEATGRPVREIEAEVLGFDHADLGGALCDKWGLPANLASPIRYHHAPDLAPEETRLHARMCYLANGMAHHFRLEVTDGGRMYVPVDDPRLPSLIEPAVLDALGVEPDTLVEAMTEAGAAATEQETFFRTM